ncbi:MAG: diphthine--ammonia ligase [Nitrososphaeria archaeon]|nr:diphthine--ammonia ligase [Nitrososphaeria archaeon]NDB51314.1 diphthine--ammonia ligase [Nitrosopumilaceae archaeon]NDB87362.1 diphthine--ammonia ligase [Nitrososphaerota archaeon]NDB45891.1 diphthine--ammonia ligase [Nitrososphaeria archaeon]NDB62752.1 diphthine--ammonia ligase [Nitrosopumilaceae archaeon]
MKLAALFSGGKDSTYAIYQARKMGHDVKCLLTIMPLSEDSHLLHHPNISATKLQAESMKIPQIRLESKSDNTQDELELLKHGLEQAKKDLSIQGVVHGGILSEFQRTKFESIAQDLGLQVIVPIWKKDQKQYMKELLDSGFEFVISAVSCDGLDESWVGKKITIQDLTTLMEKSEKFKFNLSFEGGEAETFVTNCPLFSNPIEITQFHKSWDGYRGRFEIVQAKMKNNAR